MVKKILGYFALVVVLALNALQSASGQIIWVVDVDHVVLLVIVLSIGPGVFLLANSSWFPVVEADLLHLAQLVLI